MRPRTWHRAILPPPGRLRARRLRRVAHPRAVSATVGGAPKPKHAQMRFSPVSIRVRRATDAGAARATVHAGAPNEPSSPHYHLQNERNADTFTYDCLRPPPQALARARLVRACDGGAGAGHRPPSTHHPHTLSKHHHTSCHTSFQDSSHTSSHTSVRRPMRVRDVCLRGGHVGSAALRGAVERTPSKPRLWLCGHIHEGTGAERVRFAPKGGDPSFCGKRQTHFEIHSPATFASRGGGSATFSWRRASP